MDFQVRKLFGIARHIGFGDDGAFEAELFRFFEPLLSACDGADFAAYTDFTEDHGFSGIGRLRKLESIARMTAKSAAGSPIFTPPTAFKNILIETGDAAVPV